MELSELNNPNIDFYKNQLTVLQVLISAYGVSRLENEISLDRKFNVLSECNELFVPPARSIEVYTYTLRWKARATHRTIVTDQNCFPLCGFVLEKGNDNSICKIIGLYSRTSVYFSYALLNTKNNTTKNFKCKPAHFCFNRYIEQFIKTKSKIVINDNLKRIHFMFKDLMKDMANKMSIELTLTLSQIDEINYGSPRLTKLIKKSDDIKAQILIWHQFRDRHAFLNFSRKLFFVSYFEWNQSHVSIQKRIQEIVFPQGVYFDRESYTFSSRDQSPVFMAGEVSAL